VIHFPVDRPAKGIEKLRHTVHGHAVEDAQALLAGS